MNEKVKIILSLVIGFIVAMIAMAIKIYFGYVAAYGTPSIRSYQVRLLYMPIYSMVKDSQGAFVGKTNGLFMGCVCMLFMAASFTFYRVFTKLRNK